MNYADHHRQQRATKLRAPRNITAAQIARDQAAPLIVSFIGDVRWANPTVYCDSGSRYDWSFVQTLVEHTIVVVKAGVDTKDALAKILERSDTIRVGYPVLVDVDQQEVACVIDAFPKVKLWQARRDSPLWHHYFAPPP